MNSTRTSPAAGTPASLGYRFPAEWEPHAATWLAWPHKGETWPGKFEPIPAVWQRLVQTLSAFEPVEILAGGTAVMQQARSMVGDLANVTLHDVPTNDVWARDHGPMFLSGPKGSPRVVVDWEYNAWGGKYPPYDLDNQVPAYVAAYRKCQRYAPGIVLEGGAVDSDGQGTILTTEECLLNPNRNPELSRSEIEGYLRDYCAARKVLWLGRGIAGDDTDGHIDELACFTSPGHVALTWTEEPDARDAFAALLSPLRLVGGRADDRLPARHRAHYSDLAVPWVCPIFHPHREPVDLSRCTCRRCLMSPKHPQRAADPHVARIAGHGVGC